MMKNFFLFIALITFISGAVCLFVNPGYFNPVVAMFMLSLMFYSLSNSVNGNQ